MFEFFCLPQSVFCEPKAGTSPTEPALPEQLIGPSSVPDLSTGTWLVQGGDAPHPAALGSSLCPAAFGGERKWPSGATWLAHPRIRHTERPRRSHSLDVPAVWQLHVTYNTARRLEAYWACAERKRGGSRIECFIYFFVSSRERKITTATHNHCDFIYPFVFVRVRKKTG